MTDRSGLTPPSAPDEPASPPWGAAAPQPVAPPYGMPVQYQQVTGRQTHRGALASMILGIVGLASAILALPTGGITAPGMFCSPVALGLGPGPARSSATGPTSTTTAGRRSPAGSWA